MEVEQVCQSHMLFAIKSQKFEKSEKALIWQTLQAMSQLDRLKSQVIDLDLAAQILVVFYFQNEKHSLIKDLAKQFDKSIQSKMENVFNIFKEKVKPTEKRQEYNQIQQTPLFQQQSNQMDNDQLKCLNLMNPNQNLLNMQIMQTNSPQQLLAHSYNQSQLIQPFMNSFQPFQASQPQDLYSNALFYNMPNQYLHTQNNQGVNQLYQANMYGRNNATDMMAGAGMAPYSTAQNYIQNPISLGYPLNSLPISNQQIGFPYIGAQSAAGTQQAVIDQNRINQMYYQANGFPKIPGTDNNYQVDQFVQQLQANQGTNQPIKPQKITPNSKQLQAPFQQQVQQQYQMQLQSQYQGQLPQQQLQQVQTQQKTSQNTTQKQKQQSNGNQPLNTSQSTSTQAIAKNSANSKQVGAHIQPQTSSKNSKLGITEISNQKQQQTLGTSSKSKSKSNNSNTINNQSQSSNLNSINGLNHLNNPYSSIAMRNGLNQFSAKGVETEAIKSCICSQTPRLRGQASELINCKNKGCEHKLHLNCMRISLKDEESISQFECPSCILKKYDPLHRVEQTLVDCEVMSLPNKLFNFNLSSDIFNKLRENSDYCVEVRCIRIDGTKNIYETTWPDFGCIKMNNEPVLELKPLQNNSSLKKRKDEKYTFKGIKHLKEGFNQLQIAEFTCTMIEKQQMRITENALHCISVFIIRRLTPEQLAVSIKKECTRPADECKQQIFDYFNRQKSNNEDDDDDICIDSLSVPLTCSLDMKLIQTPAKGRYCKHFQCFSLENFILTTETVNPRKWRCNICKAKCYDIVVDEYILQIISEINDKKIKNVTDVKFDGKGQYSFDQQSFQDDDDDYDDDSSKPEAKKIESNQNQATPINNSAIANPIPSNLTQITNISTIKGNISGQVPKGVSVDTNSNTNAVETQLTTSNQTQQAGQNKRKPVVLLVDSDEEPPLQKKIATSQNQNIQINNSQIPQQFSQNDLLQQLQLQKLQNYQNKLTSHANNGIGNGTNGNFGNNINMSAVYTQTNNNNVNPQIQSLMNQKNIIQSTSLADQQSQKNMMNSINSQQTSNPGNNTVNSSNITSQIPLINYEKDQSQNQSQNNYQNQSKKSISTEEEKQGPTYIQNQLNVNNNVQSKSTLSVGNLKGLIYNKEEIQRDIISDKKSQETSTNSTQSKEEAFLQKQSIQTQQQIQQESQFQNQLESQIQNQNQQIQLLQQLMQIENQKEQQQLILQEQQIQAKNLKDNYTIMESKPDKNTEVTQQKQQIQSIEQQIAKAIQPMQSKENQISQNNILKADFNSNNIGVNTNKINNPLQQEQVEQLKNLQYLELQKIEEISQSGDQSKSNQQIRIEKDGLNVERKKSEQNLQGEKQQFEDYLSKNSNIIKQNNILDLTSKQTKNSENNLNQNVPEVPNKYKLITGHTRSQSPQIYAQRGDNNNGNDDGQSKKRIYEKITRQATVGKADNPIILDD